MIEAFRFYIIACLDDKNGYIYNILNNHIYMGKRVLRYYTRGVKQAGYKIYELTGMREVKLDEEATNN